MPAIQPVFQERRVFGSAAIWAMTGRNGARTLRTAVASLDRSRGACAASYPWIAGIARTLQAGQSAMGDGHNRCNAGQQVRHRLSARIDCVSSLTPHSSSTGRSLGGCAGGDPVPKIDDAQAEVCRVCRGAGRPQRPEPASTTSCKQVLDCCMWIRIPPVTNATRAHAAAVLQGSTAANLITTFDAFKSTRDCLLSR